MKHALPLCRPLAASVLTLLAAFAAGQDSPKVIQSTDTPGVAAAQDTEVTIEGTVEKAVWSKSGAVASIEFEDTPGFMAVVFKKNREKMDEAFGGDFTKQWNGAVVRITGKLAAYGGKAGKFADAMQIVISQTGQVTVMKPATTQPTTAPTTAPATP